MSTPKLEDILEHAAYDYREMAIGLGPIVVNDQACWAMADLLALAAKRMRDEVRWQTKMAAEGNDYSECALAVLDRVRGAE